jgi:hypothetical protein
MSNIKVSGSASGTGEITIAAPVTNSSRTQTLPDATGTVMLDSAATVSGNLTFTGTGNRITGDFTNGSRPNRVMFQTSTADSPTRLGAIPSGTGTVSEFSLYNTSDPSNASTGQLLLNATEFRIGNAIIGTGTYVPMTFYNNGSEQMRLTTAGSFGIGTSSPTTKLSVVSGTNAGISVNDGTVNTIIYNSTGGVSSIGTTTNHPVDFYANNSARMRITAAGDVGIGTSSPNGNLTIQQASATTGGPVLSLWNSNNAGGNTCGYLRFFSNVTARAQIHSVIDSGSPFHGNLIFSTGENTMNERARIDSSGNLLVGATSAGAGNSRVYINGDGTNPAFRALANTSTTSVYAGIFRHESTTNGAYIQFVTDANVETGRIYDSAGTMQYASSSDARLKTNVQPLQNGLSSVLAMNPCTYDMRRGETTTIPSAGLIAQEVFEVYPYAVGVGGDDENTNPWSVDYGKLTPLLIKAIQEQQAMIQQLQAEVAALKGT